MITDFARADTPLHHSAEVCVIGAGPAGIVVALELAAAGIRVCVLESGGFALEPATQDLYAGVDVGVARMPLDRTRLRYFGGTSNHWDGQCAPLDPVDFERRDWIPHSGWPIGRRELDPFYRRAARICELPHTDFDDRLWAHLGVPALAADPRLLQSRVLQFSPPLRFGRAYRARLEAARDVSVLLHANAMRLRTDPAATRVVDVEIGSLSGRRGRVEARTFVLCCGGIENARLLLASNEARPEGLGNRTDRVGRYLMDHVRTHPARLAATDLRSIYGNRSVGGRRYRAILALAPEARRRERVLGCGIHLFEPFDADGSEEIDSVQRWLGGEVAGKSSRAALALVAEQAPSPESRVTLSEERDALGLPRVRVDWRLGELERRTFEVALSALARETGRLDVGRVRVEPWFEEGGDAWLRRARDYNHPMGTTRMAESPETGVVDRNCRVHGVENLFVGGSSVFSTGGFLNPTLTIVALALRLAAHLR